MRREKVSGGFVPVPQDFKKIDDFQNCRNFAHPEDRVRDIKKKALWFREKMLSGPKVIYYKTCDLIRVPYPVKYGLLNACTLPIPFMHILNRLFVVQFKSEGQIKTLLFSPSDIHANRKTPFFARLTKKFGPFQSIGTKFLAPELGTVESHLQAIGIAPEKIDYISYDHLHTQDLRKWLGSNTQPALFPNAKLLIMRKEWESTEALLPPQKDWYCPDGIAGIDPQKVIILDHDYLIGDGVALIQTAGHTVGNHSLVVHTDDGLFVSSENGVGADAYSPLSSQIPGVRKYAKTTGMEVILNGNTLESGLDQYISMILEKEIAGKSKKNLDFNNVVTSSELTEYWAFVGLSPTFSFGPLEYGQPKN